jgi:type III pantothenate kinase
MKYLLIDISNSFTKTASATARKIANVERIETARLTSRYVARRLQRARAQCIVVASVVPAKNREIKRAAGKIDIVWVTPAIELGVGVRYPHPRTIGADRLANAAAVAALYQVPAVVVDFGTAVTFDIVSETNEYIGGVIAPGLEALTTFLYQRTALLPKISLREPKSAIGKSTAGAMQAGAVFGYRGLVREILAQIQRERFARRQLHVIATGGYAQLIARHLAEIDVVHPNLTLEGLRIIGNLNRLKSRAA